MTCLSDSDPRAYEILIAEQRRQQDTLNLIASENHASPAVREATASTLADKYAEGLPGRRYYCGCEQVDEVERLAVERARALFGAEHANVQPHAGTNANIAVYLAALHPGDTILSMDLTHGGHLSHGRKANYSGKHFRVASYQLDRQTERLDMDAVRAAARKHRPQLIIAGSSSYPRIIDFDAFGRIAEEVGACLMCDIAHIAGLVAGKVHPSPVPTSTFVTTTTHKTLRGPRGAIILCRAEWAERIDAAVFPGLQGGPLPHEMLARAVALGEASRPEFAEYARQIVANARALAAALTEKGWRLVSGGTDNHLMLVDLRSRYDELTGQTAANWLAQAGIVANKNVIPFDPRHAVEASGVRFGTPATTTRGLKEPDMRQLAEWIDRTFHSGGDPGVLANVRGGVRELCRQFPIPGQPA